MMGKIPQGMDDLRQTLSWGGPQGRTWGTMEKGVDEPSPLGFDIAWVLILSARTLLISWLPYFPCSTWAWNHAGGRCIPVLEKVGFPGRSGLRKMHKILHMKPALLIPSFQMIRVQTWNDFVSPKFYGLLAIWPWRKISPQSFLNVIYLIITAWQWLMSFPYMPWIPMQIKPIKACQGNGWGTLLLREWPRHSKVLSPWESIHAIPFPQ